MMFAMRSIVQPVLLARNAPDYGSKYRRLTGVRFGVRLGRGCRARIVVRSIVCSVVRAIVRPVTFCLAVRILKEHVLLGESRESADFLHGFAGDIASVVAHVLYPLQQRLAVACDFITTSTHGVRQLNHNVRGCFL